VAATVRFFHLGCEVAEIEITVLEPDSFGIFIYHLGNGVREFVLITLLVYLQAADG